MKVGRPVRLKSKYYAAIERQIIKFYEDVVFKPLLSALKDQKISIKNSDDPIFDALQSGQIYYDGRYFRGVFGSKITAQFRNLGATYNRKERAYSLPDSKTPAQIRIGIQISEQRMADLQKKIIRNIDQIDLKEAADQYEFDFAPVIKQYNADLEKSLKSVNIPIKFTDEQIAIINKQWAQNLDLYVKEWADESILTMRQKILRNTMSGNRAANMQKVIMSEYGSSRKKARFLARQETSLLVSKIREKRYQEAGSFRYIWRTSEDERVRDEASGGNHKRLNGKIFFWDSPPVVDTATGRTAHPGEDFNCRCIAEPVLD